MAEQTERYWLRVGSLAWQEATLEQFIEVERSVGFMPKSGYGLATRGFFSHGVRGRITNGEITEEDWDPEFIRDTRRQES